MTRRALMLTLCGWAACLLLWMPAARAQDSTPTPGPVIIGPVTAPTAGPSPTPQPTPDDARPAVCAAPYQPAFVPVIIRPGDTLADLLVGLDTFSLTQIAALNCLDDPAALPVGAVIWLPRVEQLISAAPFDADPTVDRAEIDSFSASADEIANQSGVFFTWQAQGSAAYFYACPPDPAADCPRPAGARPVPLGYTTPVIAGFQYAGPVRYRLEVLDGAARDVRDLTLTVSCSQQVLGQFSGARQPCPLDPPRFFEGAWQPFDGGLLLWWADRGEIWALTRADGRLTILPDRYQDGDPNPSDVPPLGKVTPVRGFGQAWQTLGGSSGPLGWATALESGAQFGVQAAGRLSYTTYLVGALPGVTYAITLLPGQAQGWWVELPG